MQKFIARISFSTEIDSRYRTYEEDCTPNVNIYLPLHAISEY